MNRLKLKKAVVPYNNYLHLRGMLMFQCEVPEDLTFLIYTDGNSRDLRPHQSHSLEDTDVSKSEALQAGAVGK